MGVFHEGERAVQARAGVEAESQRLGRGISCDIPEGAAPFLEAQRLAVLAGVDDSGRVWASLVTGNPGFITAPDPRTLRLAATHAIRLAAHLVESIYTICGATAAFEGNLIQRHFQDIHVITQHVQGRLSHYELVGQHWLGLPIEDARL